MTVSMTLRKLFEHGFSLNEIVEGGGQISAGRNVSFNDDAPAFKRVAALVGAKYDEKLRDASRTGQRKPCGGCSRKAELARISKRDARI